MHGIAENSNVVIGTGSFGQVYRGSYNDRIVAIKVVQHELARALKDEHVASREIQILKEINKHPHIIELIDYYLTPEAYYLILEYSPLGDLLSYLQTNDIENFSEDFGRSIFRQIVSAVEYIHNLGYIHGDIKHENILLFDDGYVKLIDFGFATPWDPTRMMKFSKGSPNYASPETFLALPIYGPEADIWSLGVVLYSLIKGVMPFNLEGISMIERENIFLKFSTSIPTIRGITPALKDLLGKIFVIDSQKRISISGISNHLWTLKSTQIIPWNNFDSKKTIIKPHISPYTTPEFERIKTTEGTNNTKEPKEPKESKEPKELKEPKGTEERKGTEEPEERKGIKGTEEPKEKEVNHYSRLVRYLHTISSFLTFWKK